MLGGLIASGRNVVLAEDLIPEKIGKKYNYPKSKSTQKMTKS